MKRLRSPLLLLVALLLFAEQCFAQKNPLLPEEEIRLDTLGSQIVDWLWAHGIRIVVILLVFSALRYLIKVGTGRIVSFLVQPGHGNQEEREQRAHTLASVFKTTASMVLIVATLLIIIAELNPSWITPLVASLATIGIAVGLGTQNLVRDYFSGFILLLENQYTVNDVVKIGDAAGLVESITLRVTMLRDLEGVVHFIPHGQITTVTNMTYTWSRALFDVGVAYKEDVDQVMEVLVQLAKEMRADEEFGELILDDPEMLGVDAFGDSAVMIKFYLQTKPLHQWTVKRELNRRIKRKFDELGIEIPFPHHTVFLQNENGNQPSQTQ